jgi:protein-disulfide isomerase
MPSGKRARQQRQAAVAAPPPVRSTGGSGLGARQASPRTLGIIGGVILVVIVAVVLGVVLSGGGSNGGGGDAPNLTLASGFPAVGTSSSAAALSGAADTQALLKGIPQNGLVLGHPNAPVTLVEYIDLQCPVCQQFETTELATLVNKYVRTGKMKIELKPWNILDARDGTVDSLRGQKAVIAAAAQNKAFNFAQVLYDNQAVEGTNWLNDGMVANIASSVDGLNLSKLVSDANSSTTLSKIQAIDRYANARPTIFAGTPTILLAKGSEQPKLFGSGLPAIAALEAAIDAKLK